MVLKVPALPSFLPTSLFLSLFSVVLFLSFFLFRSLPLSQTHILFLLALNNPSLSSATESFSLSQTLNLCFLSFFLNVFPNLPLSLSLCLCFLSFSVSLSISRSFSQSIALSLTFFCFLSLSLTLALFKEPEESVGPRWIDRKVVISFS